MVMENANGFILFHALISFLMFAGTEVTAAPYDSHVTDGSRLHKLFVFGDSYADTGNLGKLDRSLTRSWYEPYGMTFPHHPTGRFSDGRVLPDFVASFLGIKSPVPYKFRRRVSKDFFNSGMNFAVAGSGVFDLENLQRNLSAQIDTFESQIEGKIFSVHDLKLSIALVSISGNDYSHFMETTGGNRSDIWNFIKNVTTHLKLELQRIGDLGVRTVVVTNLSPLECTPYIARNDNKCDQSKSAIVDAHNKGLTEVMEQLGRETKASQFLILDLHSAFMSIINGGKGARKFKHVFRPCCEAMNTDSSCGEVDEKGVRQYTICKNPTEHFYWDSVHPTQAGWDAVFQFVKPWLIQHLR